MIRKGCIAAFVLASLWAGSWSRPAGAELPVQPSITSIDPDRLARIDRVVSRAIEQGQMPGAVILILHRGAAVFRKAYGLRSKEPAATPMTLDTVFDLASLTKPIATATSVLLLVEEGKLRFSDRVAQYLPAFGQNGKNRITVEQLLLHTSGLIADNPEADYREGRSKSLERVYLLTPIAEPGARFIYSDMGYLVLGELVAKLAGMPLDEFAHQRIFAPLGMKDTGFRPIGSQRERAAPASLRNGHWIAGEVHDPRAFQLGGVAGHAGLFSTADDLAVYVTMLLQGGAIHGRRILSPLSVRAMTTPRPVPSGFRTYGWDVDTSFSANRGELFPRGQSFGHTGFTGTSIWIDPGSQTAVIFLSNRLHPDDKGNVTRVRNQVATLAAAALVGDEAAVRNARSATPRRDVFTGIDVLVKENFQRLKGRRIGLVTNHTGVDRAGRSTIDLLHQAEGVTLVALFSPEHGIRGAVEERVADSKDEKTGLPIYSLYGQRRKPSAENLKGIDTLVLDIQDAGCRFYTYISTLGYVLEAAGEHKLRVVVLDRPNPIGGLVVDGPVLDPGRESFIAYHALPVRHGMTMGELARLFNAERNLGADLEVVPMQGWPRSDYYDQTGLHWIHPSPNLRSLTETLLYPGIGMLETTNVSVGRGTDRPFEWVGAPWIDGPKLAAALAQENLPGVRFVPLRRTPTASVYKGKDCDGVQLFVDDWARFEPLSTGLAFACILHKLYPKAWQVDHYDDLLRHRQTWEGLKNGKSWQELEVAWQPERQRFLEIRKRYLIYAE
ncbi:MAG TPA: exo-beta-N-acetylmuramidase NamZ domain-containing protein [Gemmataceae bacterium]|nr:exo-beta-N-acetylmuramidase NamZ domain-containing protein [Gemmataceae bacterium]